MNIIDYALCQNDKFSLKKVNEVDSLIFSQFCYFRFEKLIKKYSDSGQKLYIRDIALEENLSLLFENIRALRERINFCYALAQSSRYREIEIVGQTESVSKGEGKQFSATTFLLDNENLYVAFRGTEATITGWREDFMLAYSDGIPSQDEALKYFCGIASIFPYPHVYVGGHSKGGNMAVYAAAMCGEKVKKRITKVFNHDGPGFKRTFCATSEYTEIKERICCFVPQNSVVGMIWENCENMQIVKSKGMGVFQHNPFSWLVQGDEFAKNENLTSFSAEYRDALNDWLYNTSNKKKESFFNAFINIFEKSGTESLTEFFHNIHKHLPIVFSELRALDAETKEMVIWVLKKIAIIYIKNTNVVKAGSEVAGKISGAIVKIGGKIRSGNANENYISISGEIGKSSKVRHAGKVKTENENIIDGEIIMDTHAASQLARNKTAKSSGSKNGYLKLVRKRKGNLEKKKVVFSKKIIKMKKAEEKKEKHKLKNKDNRQ